MKDMWSLPIISQMHGTSICMWINNQRSRFLALSHSRHGKYSRDAFIVKIDCNGISRLKYPSIILSNSNLESMICSLILRRSIFNALMIREITTILFHRGTKLWIYRLIEYLVTKKKFKWLDAGSILPWIMLNLRSRNMRNGAQDPMIISIITWTRS